MDGRGLNGFPVSHRAGPNVHLPVSYTAYENVHPLAFIFYTT